MKGIKKWQLSNQLSVIRKNKWGLSSFSVLMLFGFTVCTQPVSSDRKASKSAGLPVSPETTARHFSSDKEIQTGADQTDLYIAALRGKKIGMVINQTSIIGKQKTLSVDSLLALGIQIKKVFGPEHGFRGDASNGAVIKDDIDPKSGLPVISLYGKHYKPTVQDLEGLDLIIFDIQDVGARFYTYISTLHYVMEACAENNMELLILDRPNPNGFYVDGPILEPEFKSFIGMHPVPIVHGMTIGEYALMINGEGWLTNQLQCKLKIIKVAGYTHAMPYKLPVIPSPNLNTQQSILLYPSLCLFEGTSFSLGRGTQFPFQVLGHPALKGQYKFSFMPVSIAGMSENPPQKNQRCFGLDLRKYNTENIVREGKLNLSWLTKFYQDSPDKARFFIPFFSKLAGTSELQKQIVSGKSEKAIRLSWEPELGRYKLMRKKYLLYP